jgi:hypothetical protein
MMQLDTVLMFFPQTMSDRSAVCILPHLRIIKITFTGIYLQAVCAILMTAGERVVQNYPQVRSSLFWEGVSYIKAQT